MKALKLSMVIIAATMLASCEVEDNETLVSDETSSASHNTGKNCMTCHQKGGEGEGQFTIAGTVYNAAVTEGTVGAVIKLTTGARGAGTVLATVVSDQFGNFYTTKSVDYSSGVYVSMTGKSGTSKHMFAKITTGECNACHGVSGSKLSIE
ncbi:MAG TPA: hypothetical protein DCQ31_18450 [Bacteroidales bacterium]|nr:hypothetical protein [Bacteroidales bacterium]